MPLSDAVVAHGVSVSSNTAPTAQAHAIGAEQKAGPGGQTVAQ